jgi:hypothetical protein
LKLKTAVLAAANPAWSFWNPLASLMELFVRIHVTCFAFDLEN